MNKLFKGKNVAIALLIVLVVFIIYRTTNVSNYILSPQAVQTNIKEEGVKNVYDLGISLKCTPGAPDKVDPKTGKRTVMSSYYTPGLLPGGYCDDQESVNEMANYKLIGEETPLGD